MACYLEQKYEQLRNAEKQRRICDTIYASCITGHSLSEYVTARAAHCAATHAKPCSVCDALITVGNTVLEKGYCVLSEAFNETSPSVKYKADHARRKFLQMPLVTIHIGDPARGQSFSILMEMFSGMDYSKMGIVLNGLALNQTATTLEKSVVKMLCTVGSGAKVSKICYCQIIWTDFYSSSANVWL